jgi:TonB family protein
MGSETSSFAWRGMANYKHDIDKYLRGEMSPAEMNALEKKALQDPFLADALEGAQQLAPGDFAEDLNHLQHTLNKRIQKRSKGLIWLARIAAGLLLLGVSTYVIVLISNRADEKASENLALNKKQEVPSATPDNDAPSPAADSTKMQKDEHPSANQPERTGKEKLSEARGQKDQSTDQAAAEKPKADIKDDLGTEKKEPQQAFEAETTAEAVPPEKEIAQGAAEDSPVLSRRAEADKEKADAAVNEESKRDASKSISGARAKGLSNSYTVNRKIIHGKVTFSEDGMGLPGVNVLVKGSNEGTVTDSQGNYEIPVEGTQPTLLFSFIGFANKELQVKSEQLDVQLDADVSELSEVVVVGYGADGATSSPTPAVMELATPAGGRKAFKQYLESNLQYPEQALKNEVEGKVTIQFSIGMTGQLTDFRVIRGIGYGCDDEVIRLIKAGPKWHPTKKNEEPIKDRVRVRMRFALPKK